MRSIRFFATVLVLAAASAGCESAPRVSAGEQEVRVVATPNSIQIAPATVHAGNVDFVLDLSPQDISIAFVRSASGAGGALTDADLARLAQNVDSGGLSSEILGVSCCGHVFKRTLAPGKYAFVALGSRVGQPGLPPVSLAVLDVLP